MFGLGRYQERRSECLSYVGSFSLRISGYEDGQWEILDFLGEPGGPLGVEIMNVKATGLPTLRLSAHSTGMVLSPYCVGTPRLLRGECHIQRGVRGVQRCSLRSPIAAGGGEEGMEARELFHPEVDGSTLMSIKLGLL